LFVLLALEISTRPVDHARQGRAMTEPDSISVAVPNGVPFIQDPSLWDQPEPVDDSGIWSNPSAITLGCSPPDDGETDITMGPMSQVRRTNHLVFDGELDAPTSKVVVLIVPGETILGRSGQEAKTRVRIWTVHRFGLGSSFCDCCNNVGHAGHSLGSEVKLMRKTIYFADFDAPRWPAPSELEPYFLGPKAQRVVP